MFRAFESYRELPNALAAHLNAIHTGHILVEVDAENKILHFSSGREETYDHLLTTMPLPAFYELLRKPPDNLLAAARGLKAIAILNINIGVDREHISDKHWIYFPEDKFVFSRVGFPTNFSSSAGPAGTSSAYIEITHDPAEPQDVEALYERSIQDLNSCGILTPDDSILTRHVIRIPHAYVVFDHHRQSCLQDLIHYLKTRDIHTAGRYGLWDYYSMEDSILSGKAAAETITNMITASA